MARRPDRSTLAVTALAVVMALVAAGCTAAKAATPSSSPGLSWAGPTLSPVAGAVALQVPASQPFDAPSSVRVSGGTLTAVTVTRHEHSGSLKGTVDAAGTAWSSAALPVEGARYDVVAMVADRSGAMHRLTGGFAVRVRTGGSTIGYDITPSGGTVGVYAPIVIRFSSKVTDRAAVERAITVMASKPAVGAWHWINSSEVHFRPSVAWPTHTRVRVIVALHNVRLGPDTWGATSKTLNIATGDAHVTRVDGKKHTFTVYVNGKLWAKWPTSMGRPDFATRSGNYIVLERKPMVEMTSCSVHIACDPKAPNFYDLKVMQDVRLTWSGTFVHAAPWSVSHQGFENVSHGCINLSTSRATSFYDLSTYGDLVVVTHTARNAQDLIDRGDPGMTDWNTPWSLWVAGSALKAPVTATPLA